MTEDPKFSLGGQTAEDVYNAMTGKRQAVIDRAREMAQLTIPSVFPPDGYSDGDKLGDNNQSVGAWCVNTLASALMFMAFPPGRPILRFEVIEHKLREEAEADPELWGKVKLALSRKELEHRRVAADTPLRSTYTGYIKQLLVAGNGLWHHTELSAPAYHPLTQYVVRRDRRGRQLLVILKETVALQGLDEDVQDLILDRSPEIGAKDEWQREADIYTVCKLHTDERDEKTWRYWQEYKGELIPDSEVETDHDNPPMYAGWLIPVFGADYGRSYCDEYRGDLFTVENHSSSMNDGSSIAALALLFVKPGSRTSVKQVKEAENLSVLSGSAEDVTAFRLDKNADFQFVSNNLAEAIKRLARAFLLQVAIQRDAERVTKEEVVRVGNELDKAMGGLYSQLAQSEQRHVIIRFVRLHEEEDPSLPRLPDGVVRISVVTGIDSLGASTEEEALISFAQALVALFGPQVAAKMINTTDFARRLAAEKGVQTEGLLLDEQQQAAVQQETEKKALQQTLLEKATGPLAGGAAKALGDNLPAVQPQQQQ